MAKQVRVNTDSGEVSGHRVYPLSPRTDAEWYDERHEVAPDYDPATQVVEQDNKLVGDEYVYGFTVRSKTETELAEDARGAVMLEIHRLDGQMTRRRMMAAVVDEPAEAGNDNLGGKGWIIRQRGLIAAARAKL
jgi:hypothetical protein